MIIKYLSLPEAFLWSILCSINHKLVPPKRVWYSVRMFHFASCAKNTDLLLRISFFVYRLFNTHSSIIRRNEIKSQKLTDLCQGSIIFQDITNIIPSLKSHGFAEIGTLSPSSLLDFRKAFDSSTFYEDIEPQYYYLESASSSKQTGRLFVDPSVLSRNSVISNFAREPALISLLYRYFGVEPLLYQTNAWKSVAIDSTNPQEVNIINSLNSRFPHIDFGALKFLKLFIFLDPVSAKDGPFHIWPGSRHHNCRYTHDGRYDYDQITGIFGPPIPFTSDSSGSIFIADTSIYHCDGIVSQSGFRRTVQYEFCLPFIRLTDDKRLNVLL